MHSIAVIPVRFNRFTMYDMRRLHNIYYADVDSNLLINNPEEGRLAINTFVYSGAAQFRRCSAYQAEPEGCMACLADPGCVWIYGSKDKCFPKDHAVRRYSSNQILNDMRQSHNCNNQRVYQLHGVDVEKCMGLKCVPVGDALESNKYTSGGV